MTGTGACACKSPSGSGSKHGQPSGKGERRTSLPSALSDFLLTEQQKLPGCLWSPQEHKCSHSKALAELAQDCEDAPAWFTSLVFISLLSQLPPLDEKPLITSRKVKIAGRPDKNFSFCSFSEPILLSPFSPRNKGICSPFLGLSPSLSHSHLGILNRDHTTMLSSGH